MILSYFNKALKKALALGFLCLSLSYSDTATSDPSSITNVTVYGDGKILVSGITFSSIPSGFCGTHNNAFYISPGNPQRKDLLSLILTAKSLGQKITVVAYVDANCWYPEILATAANYIWVE